MANTDKEKQLQEQAAEIEKLKKQLADKEAAEQKAADEARKAADEQAAQIEKLKQQLAEKEAAEQAAAAQPERPKTKKIMLYKDERITDDVQVFVNGRQYIIKRGVEVEVPMEVFEVLQNQQRMREHIISYNAKHASE
mgnify:CR=1 FL=1